MLAGDGEGGALLGAEVAVVSGHSVRVSWSLASPAHTDTELQLEIVYSPLQARRVLLLNTAIVTRGAAATTLSTPSSTPPRSLSTWRIYRFTLAQSHSSPPLCCAGRDRLPAEAEDCKLLQVLSSVRNCLLFYCR